MAGFSAELYPPPMAVEELGALAVRKDWGKVSAVLFNMDGELCNSEELSRQAYIDVFTELGVEVTVENFVPFMDWGLWV